MTHRREFLGAMSGFALLPIAAFAQQASELTPATEMAMPAMTGNMNSPEPLLPESAIPSGAPLADLVRLKNTSTEQGIFKATLTAAPVDAALIKGSVKTRLWAYNDTLPGPLIEVTEGDTVEILFVNQLSQPSTIHWHGLPIPSEQDGNPQDSVPAGGHRVYTFTLPEDSAGTYWYHPHPHGHTAEQVYRGLAGTFIVRARKDPLAGIKERLMVCSDLKLKPDGQIADNDANDEMNGREGQFALINAQRQPVLDFDASGRERWRIWNANSARYLRLSLPGATFTLVGTDGGLLEHPVSGMDEILMAAAQRVEVIVEAPKSGGRVDWVSGIYPRGKMGNVAPDKVISLMTVDFTQVKSIPLAALPVNLRKIEAMGPARATKRVVFSESMSMAGGVHRMKFLVNGKQFDMHRIDLTSQLGEVELWEIINQSDMDHPFHIHGTQFQIIERELDGKITPEPYRAWRDIANTQSGETVRIKMVQHFKGLRMFHCHVLEHENSGMMGQVNVV